MLPLDEARNLLQNGDNASAIKILTKLVRENPRDIDAWLMLASATSDNEYRQKCLEYILSFEPDNPVASTELQKLLFANQSSTEYTSDPTEKEPNQDAEDDYAKPLPSAIQIASSVENIENREHDQTLALVDEDPVPAPEQQDSQLAGELVQEHDQEEIEQPIRGPWDSKKLNRWEQPFRDEKDVIDQFTNIVTSIVQACDARKITLNHNISQEIDSMNYALRRFGEYQNGETQSTNSFLAPAYRAALPIADEFFQEKDDLISAWITNIFTEIGKILIDRGERARQEYFPFFRSYLQLYCDLIETNFETKPDNTDDEIDGLARRLRGTIGFALGTTFKRDAFMRDFQPDQELIESLVNEALARHFKWRLKDLLDNNRPRVWPFVVSNMPKIYKLRLDEYWDEYLGEDGKWEILLNRYGFGDSLRSERNLFIIPSRVGRIHPDRLNQIRDAAAQDDFARVRDLLKINSDEVRSFLQMRAREHLDYREPNVPYFAKREDKDMFERAQARIRHGSFSEALTIMKDLWQKDLSNNGMREWIAYLQLKTGNLPGAEEILDRLQKNAAKKDISFSTDWNMAVLHNERHDDAGTYKILQKWLNHAGGDDAFLEVMLHLAIKNNDYSQFLSIVPRTRHLRFHTLAFSIAYELRDESKQRQFLAQIYQDRIWELPPVNIRFSNPGELKSTVNRAIVENQTEQLISWLGERIKQVQSYIPNYLELARVYEDEKLDIDAAFRTLDDRLKQEIQKKPRNQGRIEEACRDLLDLCKRQRRQDFGEKAFKRAEAAGASEDLLNAYVSFKASDPGQTFHSLLDQLYQVQRSTPKNQGQINKLGRELLTFAKEHKNHDWGVQAFGSAEQSGTSEQILREFKEFAPFGWKVKEDVPEADDDSLPDPWNKIPANQIISVTTDLRRIRSVNLFVQNHKIIEDLIKIITLLRPNDSGTVVELIQSFSSVLESFVNIPKDQKDQRRVLFERASSYQKRLTDLLNGNVLNADMAKMLQSFEEGTVRPVMGDLTRQVGIGPDIDAEIENPFISMEASRSTLVLRLKNISTQPVTSVFTQLMTEGDLIWLDDRGERLIDLIEPGSSRLVTFPYELKKPDQKGKEASEVVIRLSIRASAEGYPNQDLSDVRRAIPVKTMQQVIERSSIPSLFKASNPLNLDDADLFQGRQDVMEKIQESFYEGKQSERFFLDGIRRVGKTSLLNFLPKYLPESLIPIKVNFESLGITRNGFSSAEFLYTLCEQIFQALPEPEGIPILPLDEARFINKPALAFQEFFRSIKRSYPDKVVFLMVDEFQVLLDALATSAKDSLALDLMRSSIDERLFYVLFTGSTRYDRLSSIYDHRIIGSLSRLRVSFLSREDVGRVIRAGMEKWVKVPDETVQAIYDLSGGYPRLVHIYGSVLVSLQNSERRTIVTPEDVERVTREEILNNDELFSHLWNDQLGIDEEQFTETLLRQIKNRPSMSKNEYFESIAARNQQSHQRALEDLKASEVLDSSQPDILRFSGLALRRWIEIHVDSNGQLHIQRQREDHSTESRGSGGIFIDHENLVKALERISNARGVAIGDRLSWFQPILANIMREAEKRIGHLDYRVTVAFWNRPNEASLTPAYAMYDFMTRQPTEMNKPNAADFKLTTEVETAYQTSIEKSNRIKHAIVVTGDGDFAQTVLKLKNAGVQVQVWGGGKETKDEYVRLVGTENVIALDNVCGL